MNIRQSKQSGFTLVEIAIVLVIIGLLLGGVLKGQEMITSSKVNATISTMEGYKTAYYAFQDRYKALPGDSATAVTLVGNGAISCTANCDDGLITLWTNSNLVSNHLAASGFYKGPSATAYANVQPTLVNSPANAFNGALHIGTSTEFSGGVTAAAGAINRTYIFSGNNIPSKVAGEIDRKIDDGSPLTGSFRNSTRAAGYSGVACVNAALAWVTAAATGGEDCAGAWLL